MSIVDGTEYEIDEYEKLFSHLITEVFIVHNFANYTRKTAVRILLPVHQRDEYIEAIGNITTRGRAIGVFAFVPTHDFIRLLKHQRILFDIRHLPNF